MELLGEAFVTDEDADVQPVLGNRLKAIRTSKGLSLAKVARDTGISRSFLSLVEAGTNEISISRLMRLLRFYGVSFSEVVDVHGPDDYDLVRREDRRRVTSHGEHLVMHLLARDSNRSMLPMIVEIEAGGGFSEYGRHPGEECIHVLEGSVEISFEHAPDDRKVLTAGDTVWFPGERGHLVRGAGDAPARLIAVISPPNL